MTTKIKLGCKSWNTVLLQKLTLNVLYFQNRIMSRSYLTYNKINTKENSPLSALDYFCFHKQFQNRYTLLQETCQFMRLEFITFASSEGLDEPAESYSLISAFTARRPMLAD